MSVFRCLSSQHAASVEVLKTLLLLDSPESTKVRSNFETPSIQL